MYYELGQIVGHLIFTLPLIILIIAIITAIPILAYIAIKKIFF